MELLVLLIGICIVPSIVAAVRGHRQLGPIVAVNLLLGWTLLGWVAALAWALINSEAHTAAAPIGGEWNGGRTPCPRCAELIMQEAQVYRFCRYEIPPRVNRPVNESRRAGSRHAGVAEPAESRPEWLAGPRRGSS